jgi:transposase
MSREAHVRFWERAEVKSLRATHFPLYRQSQILARHGVRIERSTLAQWVGAAAAELQPLHDHLIDLLKASPRLFCDETRCPVLDRSERLS